jgi:hypothetical protein
VTIIQKLILTHNTQSHIGLSNGNSKGPNKQLCVIEVSHSPENSLLDQEDTMSIPFLALDILCYIKYVTSPKLPKVYCMLRPRARDGNQYFPYIASILFWNHLLKKCIVCKLIQIAPSQHRINVLHLIYPRNS